MNPYFAAIKAAAAAQSRRRVAGGGGGPDPDPETLTVNASRTSGVAPLAVSFDCIEAPELLDYPVAHTEWDWVWDFDDPGSGTWTPTGESRDASENPTDTHVFETPGTYTVTCMVTDPDTETVYQGTVEIEVTDPDVVFAGTATRCYSSSGDFTGAPAGATQITESDFRVVLQDMAAGRRLLLRAGDTFTFSGFISPNEPVGPGHIGSFGAGARPVIESASDTSFIGLINSGDVLRDWRFVDLDVRNGGAGGPTGSFLFAANGGTGHRLTFLRCDMDRFRIPIQFSMNNTTRNEEIAIVECVTTNTLHVALFISAARMGVLGCDLDSPTNEHTIRTHYWPTSCFAHNRIRGSQGSIRHAMKMCALATNDTHVDGTNGETELTTWSGYQSAENWAIGDNIIDADQCQFTVAIGPQSADYDERVRYGVVARNTINVGANVVFPCVFFGVLQCAFRDNVVNNIAKDVTMWRIETRGIEPAPVDNRCVDNQARYASLPPASSLTSQDGSDSGTVVSGNVATL